MQCNKKADLITIGQWIESKICFGTFEEPLTSNEKYEEIGEKFVKYAWGLAEYNLLYDKPEFFDYKVHTTMKNLVAYRLTPHAIAFAHRYQDELSFKDDDIIKNYDPRYTKNTMYLSERALCNFHITLQPSYNLRCVNMHTRDYFEQYPNEKFVVEMDGVESIGAGEGGDLVRNALSILEDVPVLLQAGFLHYGDYECEDDMSRVDKLTKFYESFGFENVNNSIGCYEESVMMLAHKDKIKEKLIEDELEENR